MTREEKYDQYIARLVDALNGPAHFKPFTLRGDRIEFHLYGSAGSRGRYDHGTYAFTVRPYLWRSEQRYAIEVAEMQYIRDVWPHAWYELFECWPTLKLREEDPIAEAAHEILTDFLPMYVQMIATMRERQKAGRRGQKNPEYAKRGLA